ncbi:hypothetical protein EGW08_004577 [Elysia chlorotica]|uniref:Uncharacterized protein n=1 Tax=Elysia chlorotica TaxID=188477 RepID=A0A433U1D0_ELYCH|nr:hypothetical protein EGW08_004577 [Elysia chlorotica]
MTRKRFFFPDIRSYALVGVELLASVCECRQREKQSHRRAVLVKGPQRFSKSKDIAIQGKASIFQRPHHNRKDQDHYKYQSSAEIRRGNVRDSDTNQMHENQLASSAYNGVSFNCAKSAVKSDNTSHSHIRADAHSQFTLKEHDQAEYNIDKNWKLQMQRKGNSEHSSVSNIERDWDNNSDNDYNPHEDRYKHSRIPGITNVESPAVFHFPNNSIFRAGSEDSAEDLGIIEEEIERAQRVKLVTVKGGHVQGGYITSRTEDGREIFIPASYTAKSASGGNSGSSGYGSSTGGYSSEFHRQVHKTASAATVSSFEDDILEVLPGMTDVEERPKRHSEGMLKELFKAKRDALEEGLIESYEERVRRSELGSKFDDLPDGVVFPKKNKDKNHNPTVEELLTGHRPSVDTSQALSEQYPHTEQEVQQLKEEPQHHPKLPNSNNISDVACNNHTSNQTNKRKNTNSKSEILSSSKRPVTAEPITSATSITQRLQRGVSRPLSASNTSFREWNARSSLKRNKARAALKRALSSKGNQRVPHHLHQDVEEERGLRLREIEKKYSNRPGSSISQVSSVDSEFDCAEEDIINIQKAQARSQGIVLPPPEQTPGGTNMSTAPVFSPASGLPEVEEGPALHHFQRLKEPVRTNNVKEPSPKPTVARKPSTKSRPAPPPPPNDILAPITIKSAPKPISSHVTNEAVVVPIEKEPVSVSEFDTDTQSVSHHHADESFTSVDPASSSKSSSSNTYSNASSPSDQAAEKIESDMKDIINSSATSEGHRHRGNTAFPPGIRLIDSGFDSESISSEESCLCAAAALEPIDDGDASGPSEIFSQGTCSCACSNCLGSNPRRDGRNGSSWTGSQDSESWSNSNSFSSYDANMHRRMLPVKRESDVSGCVLAPDEQYPLPSHGSRSGRSNSLHPHTAYSPKRNHRRPSKKYGQQTSSASETSSVASRRYRELVKKGVPLRVSVVAADSGKLDDKDHNSSSVKVDDMQCDKIQADGHLFNDLQQKGFFERGRTTQTLHYVDSPRSNHFSEDENDETEEDERYQGLSPIPSLEDIIKEIPDETGQFPDETKAFLNRPESEVSIKALQAVLTRTGSSTDEKTSHPAELIIDRIFTHQGPSESMVSTFGLSQNGLDLDVSAIREVAMLPGPGSPYDLAVGVDIVGLLAGMDGRHVTYCHRLSSQLHLVSISDLLPATPEAFEKLRLRLQQTGRVGRIGNQILDSVLACWLYSSPPTSTTVMEQLSDKITETEL